MAFVEWTESLSVGYRLIDTDHKRLIDLLNKVHEASEQGLPPSSQIAALDALIQYTKTHFIHEDTLMRKNAYPQFIPHKIEHDRLLGQIEDLRKRFAAGQASLSHETLVFLRTWLCDHFLKVDHFLGDFLNKVAPQPAEGS